MDKYQELVKLTETLTDEQIMNVFTKIFGKNKVWFRGEYKSWFRSELKEWLDNCNDAELDKVEKIVNQVRKANNG